MRGRKPRPLSIAPADLPILRQIARAESLPWYQVRRARIVLANARGVSNSTIAFQVQCDEATVWRTCRRYERDGLDGLLAPLTPSCRPNWFRFGTATETECGPGPAPRRIIDDYVVIWKN